MISSPIQISIRTGVVHAMMAPLRLALPRTATLPSADIAKEMRYKRLPFTGAVVRAASPRDGDAPGFVS